jgi:translation initiation factor IF-2
MKKKQEEADKKAADESDKATRDADEKAKREANAAKELEEIKFSQLDLQEQYNALMEEANSMVVKTKEDELKYQKLLIQAKEVEAKIEDKKKKDAQEAKEAKEEEQKKFKESLSSEGFEIGDDGKLRRKGKKAIVSAADYARTKAAREKAIADAARTGQPIDDKKALTLAEKQANAIEEIRQALSIQQKL